MTVAITTKRFIFGKGIGHRRSAKHDDDDAECASAQIAKKARACVLCIVVFQFHWYDEWLQSNSEKDRCGENLTLFDNDHEMWSMLN
jgi:hypothetical protein